MTGNPCPQALNQPIPTVDRGNRPSKPPRADLATTPLPAPEGTTMTLSTADIDYIDAENAKQDTHPTIPVRMQVESIIKIATRAATLRPADVDPTEWLTTQAIEPLLDAITMLTDDLNTAEARIHAAQAALNDAQPPF